MMILGWVLLAAGAVLGMIPRRPLHNPVGIIGFLMIAAAVYIEIYHFFPSWR